MKKSYVMMLLSLCVLACTCVQAENITIDDKLVLETKTERPAPVVPRLQEMGEDGILSWKEDRSQEEQQKRNPDPTPIVRLWDTGKLYTQKSPMDDAYIGEVGEAEIGRYVHDRVRVDEAGQSFTFKSPVDCLLDYILVYLWDRTEKRPEALWTPMDVYRETIERR